MSEAAQPGPVDLLRRDVARVTVAWWAMRAGVATSDIARALDMTPHDVLWLHREALAYRLALWRAHAMRRGGQ